MDHISDWVESEPTFTNLMATVTEHPLLTKMSREDYLNWWYKFNNNWHVCNLFCKTYLLLDFVIFFAHLALNVGPLQFWAHGNVGLITYSLYTYYMSIFCAMLLVGSPSYMMAKKNIRTTIFSLSLLTLLGFNAQVGILIYKYWNGLSHSNPLMTTVSFYILFEQIGAFFPALFIFLYDGLAYSDYALFSPNYGKWKDAVIPGQEE